MDSSSTQIVVEAMGWASQLVPYEWKSDISDLIAFLRSVGAIGNASTYLTGWGMAGALAEIIGAIENIRTITFNAPQLSDVSRKLSASLRNFESVGSNIGVEQGLLSAIGGQSSFSTLNLPCTNAGSAGCTQLPNIAKLLLAVCGSSDKLHQ
jgi:hypothetical protein